MGKPLNMMTSSNGNIFRDTGHCAGNSPVTGEFPIQRPVTRSFVVYFDLRPNKRLSKQSRGWWFETLSPPLWRHHNEKPAIWNALTLMWRHTDLQPYIFQNAMPCRFKAFHFYNIGVLFEVIFKMLMPFLSKKFRERVRKYQRTWT